jgi:hypothetical protein
MRLYEIIKHYNEHKKFPGNVNSQYQFGQYKAIRDNPYEDITYYLFEFENKNITEKNINCDKIIFNTSGNEDQFSNYKLLNYTDIQPVIQKYFTVSQNVIHGIKYFEDKYKLNYENICVIRYRGNDKAGEICPPSFQEIIDKASEIKNNTPDIQFLVQTDVIDFINIFCSYFQNTIYFKELLIIPNDPKTGIHRIESTFTQEQKFKDIVLFNAAIQIMAKCKYIICTSGNGELWTMIYRGHANGVYQYLKPLNYHGEQTDFWV